MHFDSTLTTQKSYWQPAASEEAGASINDVLPQEMIKEIFSRMPSSADSKVVQVCSFWNDVVQFHQPLRVIGEEIWKEYLDIEAEDKVPPLPEGISETVRSGRERLAGRKAAPFCTAILMPKGLTPNKLIERMKNPKKGYSTELEYIDPKIVAKYGGVAIEESYWLVVTNDVIEETRTIPRGERGEFIKRKTNSEWDLSTYLGALVWCGMHHVIYGEHLLGRERSTFAQCQEQIDDRYPIDVGGFASGGLDVNFDLFDVGRHGALACRKFC